MVEEVKAGGAGEPVYRTPEENFHGRVYSANVSIIFDGDNAWTNAHTRVRGYVLHRSLNMSQY